MRKLMLATVLLTVVAIGGFYAFPGVGLRMTQAIEHARSGVEVKSAEVGDLHWVYLEGGSGPPLVLLHGFGADKEAWTWVARYLTPHFRVIAPDLPGFGESTRGGDRVYGYEQQVARIHDFLKTIGVTKLHLAGNSMGGNLAGVFAAEHPDELLSLWLLAPAGVATARKSEVLEMMDHGENPLVATDVAGFQRLLAMLFVEAPPIPGPVLRYLTDEAIARHDDNDRILKELLAHPAPLEERLKGLPIPTLVQWGSSDRLLDASGARILGDLMPQATVFLMPNVGHVPMVERPEESAAAFLEFRGLGKAG